MAAAATFAAILFLKLAAGMLADRVLGDPRRFHPLAGFGCFASAIENLLRREESTARMQQMRGLLAWTLAVLPWVALALWLHGLHPGAHWIVDIALLWFALGGRSLAEHGEAVAAPLAAGDLAAARARVGWIVSRETAALDAEGVARAGTESVLENGNDAVFGALFWFILLGGPGALLFRLANTLDAMWGYRTPRYLHFGRAAARLDDALNWLPARLTALTYALLGDTRNALACWRTQAAQWDSPNAGPVMAAGAGALAVQLGGNAIYHGRAEARPVLGCGAPPDARSLRGAIRLVRRGMLGWLALVGGIALLLALAAALAGGTPHA
ncbi:adenosylcobinamide-phosphate synthase CbiB [Pseudothauera rhizosphaerae]|uniref:Cobalamin biosynthesis protein CobD n=1 Tax=Pseudothauera rhizosphaerae TaxID=2565932 RepID=A0A4S4AB70_9RHOO|nr:adenosylcobinamide-phosphate synthase CbiB [Pseudothauera rhizosphaerae]THF56207.1 cobalamin biosynthesis protein [Pseudothauera rhizosphaerae]